MEDSKIEIVRVAKAIINNDINLIEGSRKISFLRLSATNPEDEIFSPFRVVDSDSDHYPLGKVRESWNADALKAIDCEIDLYIADVKESIIESCKRIISQYASEN